MPPHEPLRAVTDRYRRGDVKGALKAARDLVRVQPMIARFRHVLADLEQASARPAAAILALRQGVALDPTGAALLGSLAALLQSEGNIPAAVALTRRAAWQLPNLPTLHYNLADQLLASQTPIGTRDAIARFRRTLALAPLHLKAHFGLARHLADAGDAGSAISHARIARMLAPGRAAIHVAEGLALRAAGRHSEAFSSYRRGAALDPAYGAAHCNLGNVRHAENRETAAIAHYRMAVLCEPQSAEYHWNLALALLVDGQMDEGWREYRWRWRWTGFGSAPHPSTAPRWDGEPLDGRTLLIHAEQGLGDTLQFCRYLPLIGDGGRLIFQLQDALIPLVERMPNVDRIVSAADEAPDHDLVVPLLDLPRICGTSSGTIPSAGGYLAPPCPAPGRGIRPVVGLCWAGNPEHRRDSERSVELGALRPLMSVPGIDWRCLQFGADQRMLVDAGWADVLALPDRPDRDMADTANRMSGMDLIITVDTSVAHLAGALGKPAWVMLTFSPDWRWLHDREDSPWYASLRLWRQKTPGNWSQVIDRMAYALSEWIKSRM